MSRVKPNQLCPCGSEDKFKKCCDVYLKGGNIVHPEALCRARYTAMITKDAKFLWGTLHPNAPVKTHQTFHSFEKEQQYLFGLDYQELILLDGYFEKNGEAKIVFFVRMKDGQQDLSFLEEADYEVFEGNWYYKDGLRRSANTLGCDPMSVKVGQLETIFPWDSGLN